MTFFPEYTDHGIAHLELTLQTAWDFVTKEATEKVTQFDAAALAVAVALHDFGMYLTIDGFESLIGTDSLWKGNSQFKDKPWPTLWSEFYGEATRFDDRKLRLLFGDKYRPVRPLPEKGAEWGDFDKLLVGEFLRRHHPRLAHEIALYGLPAMDGAAIPICPTDSEEVKFWADISGLIARSHGMSLRPCLDYLEKRYRNKINPRGINAAFLAVLLRIADYFQIQDSRAPSGRTDARSFQSGLSEREWKVHQCVKDINNTGADPEAIVVIAEPEEVRTFLKLKQWIDGLQDELDRSWAILGEVYGLQGHNGLNKLGLKIRRVKSNIDDTQEFAQTVTYLPAKVAFEAANADLLKLLVAPLYSNDPAIGIRELIQNAVDAVREFEDSALRHPELALVDRYKQDSDIVLQIDCDKAGDPTDVTVTDRGIGMNAQVVRDYFLKAGASLRRSDAWRQQHEDSGGHSRVLRTGRFGVGALAAFLLGDEVEVTTRNAFSAADDGLTFSARLDEEAISVKRTTCPVGTRIRVKVPGRLRASIKNIIPGSWQGEKLDYRSEIGHYFLKKPTLTRICKNKEYVAAAFLPQLEDTSSLDWRYFVNNDYEKIFWTYKNEYPNLSCNGIIIYDSLSDSEAIWNGIRTPRISVFDRDGLLPVNLQRTGLQGGIPFEEDLLRSICDDIIAHALIEAVDGLQSYEGKASRRDLPWFLLSRRGFVLSESGLLNSFRANKLVVLIGGHDKVDVFRKLQPILPEHALFTWCLGSVFSDNQNRVKGIFQSAVAGLETPRNLEYETYTTYIPSVLIDKIKGLKPGKALSEDLKIVDSAPEKEGWKVISGQSAEPSRIPGIVDSLAAINIQPLNPFIVCEFDSIKWGDEGASKPIADRWMEILGTPLIPYDFRERQNLVQKAETHIGELLRIHREIAAKKSKSEQQSGGDASEEE